MHAGNAQIHKMQRKFKFILLFFMCLSSDKKLKIMASDVALFECVSNLMCVTSDFLFQEDLRRYDLVQVRPDEGLTG